MKRDRGHRLGDRRARRRPRPAPAAPASRSSRPATISAATPTPSTSRSSGRTHGVDIGFVVFNERGVAAARRAPRRARRRRPRAAEMSFSAQVPRGQRRVEQRAAWAASSRSGANLLAAVVLEHARRDPRGSTATPRSVARATARRAESDDSLGDFLDRHRFSKGFRDWYLLPMLGCIWSCPPATMLRMPVARDGALLRRARGCCGSRRPARSGARFAAARACYVDKMLGAIADARLATPVRRDQAPADGRRRRLDRPRHRALRRRRPRLPQRRLARPARRPERRRARGARLRSTTSATARCCTPTRACCRCAKSAWAAWNYEAGHDARPTDAARLRPPHGQSPPAAAVRRAGDRLAQPDPGAGRGVGAGRVPLCASGVRPARRSPPRRACPALQGRADTWFCGAWTGLGSHEDGLRSALDVCAALGAASRAACAVPAKR